MQQNGDVITKTKTDREGRFCFWGELTEKMLVKYTL